MAAQDPCERDGRTVIQYVSKAKLNLCEGRHVYM